MLIQKKKNLKNNLKKNNFFKQKTSQIANK